MKKNKKNNDRWQGYTPAAATANIVCTTEERKTAM